MEYLNELNLRLQSLVIFRALLKDPVVKLFPPLLTFDRKNGSAEGIGRYAEFTAELFSETENLTEYLWKRVFEDENFYIHKSASGEKMPETMENCLDRELNMLEELSRLSAERVITEHGIKVFVPKWAISEIDFTSLYKERIRNIAQIGYGIYSSGVMFTLDGGKVTTVKTPDPVRLKDLKGYCDERQAVIDNTLALLSGKPAANALLYGDAGTGKSSTVKAVVNEYASEGLRLIEVRKNQLLDIPNLVESLGKNPLKFIIFIDDLSFAGSNEQIGALKAVLEGSASSKTANVVIYATSNRRHIINEKFSDRDGDDIHVNETIQEHSSLSDRFALAVYFGKPDMENYLAIVRELAADYGIKTRKSKLDALAEAYATKRGGRSPRVARQFIESLRCGAAQ